LAKRKDLVQIHIAVFLFGLAGLFGKLVDQPALIIVLGRVFFGAIALFILYGYRRQSIRLKQQKDYLWFALFGLILAVHWLTFFHSIKISSVAIGLLTYSTFPIFTAFLEPYFFKEKLLLQDFILAIITFLGVILVIPSFELGNEMTQGALWGIVSGATFAILSILNRKYVADYPGSLIALYQDTVASLLLLPFFFVLQPVLSASDLGLLILLGFLFTAFSHTIFINGLQTVKAKTASIIASLEPVYGILGAILLLGEAPTLPEILGGSIILGATFYATYKPS
ncbi:MAG: DMT family transporter, partial [Saprospiraceae bacterium]|nr:DMT family transporter [Saprospiraceae bacterium]